MTATKDEELFAFLYTIAAGVRSLRSRASVIDAAEGESSQGADIDRPDRLSLETLPDPAKLAVFLDLLDDHVKSAEVRMLDLGREIAQHEVTPEAQQAAEKGVREVLDRLGAVRGSLNELRSFDHRVPPLSDFLSGQRQSIDLIRSTLEAIEGISLRAQADRELTLHRLRSGVPVRRDR